MKNLFLTCFLFLLPSCLSDTGGAYGNVMLETQGIFASSDLNTAVVITSVGGYVQIRQMGGNTAFPIWLADFGDAGTYVWVRELVETGDEFEGKYAPGEALPLEIEPYVRSVMTQMELDRYDIAFE